MKTLSESETKIYLTGDISYIDQKQSFLGTNTVTYLDNKPLSEHAENLAQQYSSVKENPIAIYLISSAPEVAKELSQIMFSKGFKNLVVHTFIDSIDYEFLKQDDVYYVNLSSIQNNETYQANIAKINEMKAAIASNAEKNHPKKAKINSTRLQLEINKLNIQQKELLTSICKEQKLDDWMPNKDHAVSYKNGKEIKLRQTSTMIQSNNEPVQDNIKQNLPPCQEIDFLQRLLGWWPSLFATDFTKTLATNLQEHHQLKLVQHDMQSIMTEEKDLTSSISESAQKWKAEKQDNKMKSKISNSATFLVDEVLKLNTKQTPEPTDIATLQSSWALHSSNKPKHRNREKVQSFVDRTILNTQKKIEVNTKLSEIRQQMAKDLMTYIQKYANVKMKGNDILLESFHPETSTMHKAKVNVMLEIHHFLKYPTHDAWEKLQAVKNAAVNRDWDKGFFSKVRKRMHEVEKFHDVAQEEDLDVIPKSPLKKQ